MDALGFGYQTQQGEKRMAADYSNVVDAAGEHFVDVVDELLNFPNDEDEGMMAISAGEGGGGGGDDVGAYDCSFVVGAGNSWSSTDSSTMSNVGGGGGDSCNSSSSFSAVNGVGVGSNSVADTEFSGDLCVPYDDLAELEWLSNFVEESFSSEDLQQLQLISGVKSHPDEESETRDFQANFWPTSHHHTNTSTAVLNTDSNHPNPSPIFGRETAVPGKARSKRSRTAASSWSSRLLVLSPPPSISATVTTETSSTESDVASDVGLKPEAVRRAPKRKLGDLTAAKGEGRRCLHCATDRTPQWRTGPMGPKTLCNACGVRYKSGRLVPEYRPAASPTFVLTKHSNSHRKVMELRRQKELMRQQQQQNQLEEEEEFVLDYNGIDLIFDGSDPDDYLIHQPIGPDFRQLT